MLVAYMDESGIHAGSRICAIAGYVGPAEEWQTFEHRWKRAITDAGITAFHMATFQSRRGEFAGWSDLRREQLLAELVGIIKARDLLGVGSGLVIEDYERLSDEDKTWMTHGNPEKPYFLCFQHCIVEAAHRADGLPPQEKVAFAFDRQDEFSAEAIRLYNDMKGQADWENKHRLADAVGFASKVETVALQAADLLAYECYKHLENRLYDPQRGVRWPMGQLRRRPFVGKYFDANGFQALLDQKPKP